MATDISQETSLKENVEHAPLGSGVLSEKFIQPCLMYLLHRQNSYGYELIENLKTLGISPDASSVYRNLRRMEKEGLVRSEWDTKGNGPAKRYYKLTADGEDLLYSWVLTVRKNKNILENFLELYTEQMAAQEGCEPCGTGGPCCVPRREEKGEAATGDGKQGE